jgi:autotransporter-associated beta strand protein
MHLPHRSIILASALFFTNSVFAQGFALQQGYLEPVISRANRPGQVITIIQNTNVSAANNITVQLQLPAGVVGLGTSVGLTSSVPAWNAGQIMQFTWDVQSSVATNTAATVLVKQGAATLLNTNFPVWWQNTLTVTNQNYVPAPVAVGTGRYLIGAMICPFWRETGFSSIYGYPDRKPALGFYDEGDFEATDWQVKWALEHGVKFFAACWYRNPANVGLNPVMPQHQRWLEGGFLNGRYGSQAKFAIMSVGNIVSSQGDLVTNVFPYWLQNYFSRSNYLVLDNKPVVYFFTVPLSSSVMSNALVQVRAQCVAAGFSGLYAIGCYDGFTAAGANTNNMNLLQAGMDYSFAYHLPTFMNIFSGQHPTQAQAISGHQTCWTAQEAGVIPNLVTVSSGWDSQPWGFSTSSIQWRLDPTNYTTLLQNAKSALDSRGGTGLDTKILLLDDWNEYGEGHFFGVTRQYAWGYLDAVRQVFATNAPAHIDLAPQDIGRGTPYLDGQDRGSQILASADLVNIPAGGLASYQIHLSAAPTNTIVVSNTVSLGVTNISVTIGNQITFTPLNWKTPQNVTVSANAPNAPQQSVFVFSTAGGGSGYADDCVQANVFAPPTNLLSAGSWSADANGNWSAGGNWLSGAIPSGLNGTASFTNNISTSRTITADTSPGAIGNLLFGSPGGNNWTLTGNSIQLSPTAQVAVNANTATISNALFGAGSLTKTGVGTLVLAGANSYAGGTFIQAGTVQAANTNAVGNQQINISSGATLDASGNALGVDAFVSGSGVGGNGALVNTAGMNSSIQNLTLNSDTTMRDVYGGLTANGLVAGNGYTLTILGNSGYGYVSVGRGQSSLGDINIVSGSFMANGYIGNTTGCLGIPTNTITIASGAALQFVNNGSATHNKQIVVNGGKISESQGGNPTLIGPITLNSACTIDVADTLTISGVIGGAGGFTKTSAGTLILSGTNTFTGATILSAGTTTVAGQFALQNSTVNYSAGMLNFSVSAATIGGLAGSSNLGLTNLGGGALPLTVGQNNSTNTFSGVLSGSGSLIKNGSGVLSLNAGNTYSGNTIVSAGTLQLGAAGSISNSSMIAISNNAALDVSAVPGGFILGTNCTLTGNGVLAGNFTANGMVIPGNPLGTLNIGGTATLRGTIQMQIAKNNGVRTNNLLSAMGAITYGGSLFVTNIGSDLLSPGDCFKLFDSSGFTGAFTNVALPKLGAGLSWTNHLAVDGSLTVLPSLEKTNLIFTVVGSSLQLSWPADHIGWRLQNQTNSISAGLGTNWIDVSGSAVTNFFVTPINPSVGLLFFRLVYP